MKTKNGKVKLFMVLTVCILSLVASMLVRYHRFAEVTTDTGHVKEFTAYFAYRGEKLSEGNRVQEVITEKIGAKVIETWQGNSSVEDEIGMFIASGEYPDFIDGSTAIQKLIGAGALRPLEDYIENYPNIKAYLAEKEWEKLKDENGHIYIIPQFSNIQGEETSVIQQTEAFWIQKAVLEWAGYPEITTVEEYLDLIYNYQRAFPTINGQETIGFQILCDDWRYFCLENPPQFLAGYPNDGNCIVDPETGVATLYDFIPEARSYFKKLNEMFHKGVIKADTFVKSYDQYLELIESGRVLGFVDQYWQFQSANQSLYTMGMPERTYVALGLTVDKNVEEQYRSKESLDVSNGLGISISCEDFEGALQLINDLLDPQIMKLRYWGEEGIDYEVDEKGLFYRSEEQRNHMKNINWKLQNLCDYDFFPHYEGMLADLRNTVYPEEQPGEFFASLCEYDKNFLEQYGFKTWVEFLNEPKEENAPWFPLYSFSNGFKEESWEGKTKKAIEELRREGLPQLIMCEPEEFEHRFLAYKERFYETIEVERYEKLLTDEVYRRIKLSKDNS